MYGYPRMINQHAILQLISTQAPISTFVPIIIRGFGFTRLQSLLLVIPAGFYAGCVQLILPYSAYRFKNIRSYLVIGAQVGTIIASALLWRLPLHEKGALLFACYILPSLGGGYAVLMGMESLGEISE